MDQMLIVALERIARAIEDLKPSTFEKKKFVGDGKQLDYRASLVGFHNPHTHKGLTSEKFLNLYVRRLKSMSKKKDGQVRLSLTVWIKENWDSQLKFVERLFPSTLKE